jgi:cysteine desulfurase
MTVYLDHNATTPLDPRVLEAMLPFLREQCGNASSRHELGSVARQAIDRAREQVAAAVGVQPAQVIFTSGGTEANNLFIRGAAAGMKPGRITISAVEHPCVAATAADLQRQGWTLRRLKVTHEGVLDAADVEAALGEKPALWSVMLAHNETGVVQDITPVAARARSAGAVVHSDAVQALGKIAVDFRALNVQALTLSAHKINGPKGAGALVVDKRLDLRALLTGGGQERGLRGGTENVPAIVGFGAACEIATARLAEFGPRLAALRERLERGLAAQGAVIFGEGAPRRLPNTSYFALRGIHGEALVIELDKAGYATGSGAACSSASTAPSATLLAMGVEPELARGAVRVSLGAGNDAGQIDGFLQALAAAARRLRGLQAVAV